MDTGPLVASINRRDRFHLWAKAQCHSEIRCREIHRVLFTLVLASRNGYVFWE
jgi:hypothetical protein